MVSGLGLFGLIIWVMEKGAVGCGLNHLDKILDLRNLQFYIAGSVSKELSEFFSINFYL